MNMPPDSPVVIMGGTFDPVHVGHIQIALDVVDYLQIDRLHLVPVCESPSGKQPVATPAQRFAMLERAVAPHACLVADAREIERGGVSYSVDTLTALREQYPDRSITIVMGMDAYLSLPYWHEWEALPKLANILVLARGTEPSPPVPPALAQVHARRVNHANELLSAKNGRILVKNLSLLNISSTLIRKELMAGTPSNGVPSAVLKYVLDNQLYGPQE